MDYFVAINGTQQGPFPPGDLIARGVNGETLVWCEGMSQWQRADAVDELRPLFAGAPVSPLPPPVGYAQPSGYTQPPGSTQPLGYGNTSYAPAYVPGQSNRTAVGLCAILLGSLGVHKFMLGQTGAGIAMLLITLLTCGLGGFVTHVIGIIEGIIYLTKTDEEFHQIYVVERRSWF